MCTGADRSESKLGGADIPAYPLKDEMKAEGGATRTRKLKLFSLYDLASEKKVKELQSQTKPEIRVMRS